MKGGLTHASTPTQKRVPRPSRVLCERAGLLADIAAADHRIHAKLLTTARCPARFNLDRTSGSVTPQPLACAKPPAPNNPGQASPGSRASARTR